MIRTLIITLAAVIPLSSINSEPIQLVPPTSEEWLEIYDPPHKVPTELPTGSKLRAALFAMLRPKAGMENSFSGSLMVYRNWAFFVGRTVDSNGVSIKHPPMGNDDATGLWVRTKDDWVLVDYSFGFSDAFYVVWPEQYGVPRKLLGMQQIKKPNNK